MAVFELVYQRLEGPRRRPAAPALAIAESDLRVLRRRRAMRVAAWLLGLYGFALAVFVVFRAGFLDSYLPFLQPRSLPPVDAAFFATAFFSERGPGAFRLILLLLALFAGAGRIADDLRSNALSLYLSRALTRGDYLLGKVLATALPVAVGAIGLPMLIYLLAGVVDPRFFAANLRTGVALFATGALVTAYLSAAVLWFSSLVRSGRAAGVLFAMFVMLSGTVQDIVRLALGRLAPTFLGFFRNTSTVAAHLLGVAGEQSPPLLPALLAILAVIAVGFLSARRRIRAVEVVR